jgi:radical SAM protein with 4Fe4S-binding SPASM domain
MPKMRRVSYVIISAMMKLRLSGDIDILYPLHLFKLLNRFQLLKDHYLKKTECAGFPILVTIELTNVCNLKCIMCPRTKGNRDYGYMDMGLFRKIVDEISGKAEMAYLHLFGESLMHPSLIECIRYAKSKGIATALSSNGSLLTEKMSKKIIEAGLDYLTLSFDGASRQVYEKVRVGADYEEIKKNIQRYIELNDGRTSTFLQLIKMDLNEAEIQAFKKMWKKYRVNLMVKTFSYWLGEDEELKQWRKQKSGQDKKSNLLGRKLKGCELPWWQTVIHYDGTVVPCCHCYSHKLVLGDAAKETVGEIWNNEKYKRFRSDLIDKKRSDIPLCQKCMRPSRTIIPWLCYVLMGTENSEKIASLVGRPE